MAQSKSPQHTALPVLDQIVFLTPPRGTEQKFSTHCSTGFDRIFVFSTPPRGKDPKSSTHCSIGPRPNFFSHATSWHKAKVLNSLLYRSSTAFLSFLHHLVAKSKRPQHTALSVLDRNVYLLHATSWYRAKVCDSPLHRFPTETLF